MHHMASLYLTGFKFYGECGDGRTLVPLSSHSGAVQARVGPVPGRSSTCAERGTLVGCWLIRHVAAFHWRRQAETVSTPFELGSDPYLSGQTLSHEPARARLTMQGFVDQATCLLHRYGSLRRASHVVPLAERRRLSVNRNESAASRSGVVRLSAEEEGLRTMRKAILITGSTDGIGLETAKMLVLAGHIVMMHGRNETKLRAASKQVSALSSKGSVETFLADFSRLKEVDMLATKVMDKHKKLDVLINNAGVLKASHTSTPDGLDVRFAVNTIAPYLLTKRLLPLLGESGRVVNVGSAAQSPVNVNALVGRVKVHDDMGAYAQSKLGLTMWTKHVAKDSDAVVVAVNPGSLLGSKMVKEGFGVDGGDLRIGAEILKRAAVSEEFANASGKYFDNDSGKFKQPHRDALSPDKTERVIRAIEQVLEKHSLARDICNASERVVEKGSSAGEPSGV